jgi:hydroxymethylpyrimidine pyrophosphatase-like HAD family hydrolase
MKEGLSPKQEAPNTDEGQLKRFEVKPDRSLEIKIPDYQPVLIFRTGDSPLALEKIFNNSNIDTAYIRDSYNSFNASLADIFIDFRKDENLCVHCFDAKEIAHNLLSKIHRDFPKERFPNGVLTINLDKVVQLDPDTTREFKTSRLYMPGGNKKLDQIESPGSQPIQEQIRNIVESSFIKNEKGEVTDVRPIVLFEDDYFGGGTIKEIAKKIQEFVGQNYQDLDPKLKEKLKICKIYAGIQVGNPELNGLEIPLESAVKYTSETNEDLSSNGRIELLDFRDFLIGLSGLVIQDPDLNQKVRLPYILPFVSPNSRASIPEEKEIEFSKKVLLENIKFYEKFPEICLKHVDESFKNYIINLSKKPEIQNKSLNQDSSMKEVCKWILKNFDQILEVTKKQRELFELATKLKPDNTKITLDYNGTFDGDLRNEQYQEKLTKLKEIISKLREKGFEIGLNSDSSLDSLLEVQRNLGDLDFILSENGNTLSVPKRNQETGEIEGYETKSVQEFNPDLKSQIIKFIKQEAEKNGLELVGGDNGILAPEITGQRLEKNQYAFSRGRSSTVAIYCGQEGAGNLVDQLNSVFKENGYHVDEGGVSTGDGYGYFCVQPRDLKTNKNTTSQIISRMRKDSPIIHIGDNPLNDNLHSENTETRYVAKARERAQELNLNKKITAKMNLNRYRISQEDGIDGVIEILKKILEEGV